jgi:DNA-binding NarL/FixJ family response regulator
VNAIMNAARHHPPALRRGFLVVEPDPKMAAAIARRLRRYGTVQVARSLAEAEAPLHRGVMGVVLEPRLADGDGLAFVRRHRDCCRPFVLVHTDRDPVGAAAVAYEVGCHFFLLKPTDLSTFDAFGHRAVAASILPVGLAEVLVAELARKHGLSAQQIRILALEIAGVDRKGWGRLLGVRSATLHTMIHQTVRRLGVTRLADVARPIVQAVLAPHLEAV